MHRVAQSHRDVVVTEHGPDSSAMHPDIAPFVKIFVVHTEYHSVIVDNALFKTVTAV